MSVQMCEGVWRTRCGRRVVITRCDSDDNGQQWTDGEHRYSDNGSFFGRYGGCSEEDLVEHLGLLTDSLKRAPVGRPAETESTTAFEGGVANDPGRVIYDLELKLKAANAEIDRLRTFVVNAQSRANATIIGQTAEIDRLKAELQQTQVWRTAATDAHSQSEVQRTEMQAENERLQAEWQTEFTAAQQLRSEVQQLEGLNYKLSEALRDLQEDHTAMDHRAEGARLAFLDVIKTLLEMRR